ncbi:hypothetical protein MAR_034189 [Mya arenaria]|uniref:Uncharacterized protein n=1 Tax=Mya arenaria TaxID=6604 RepID=A0ABY7GE77_MYAAR|nr:hypothetical protein MAR_034189 [Mya arenaria]
MGGRDLDPKLGAITGTSHETRRPMNAQQQQHVSAHRNYHCLHSTIIVENKGHLNDDLQLNLIASLGGPLLPFPYDCTLIGNKIYPDRESIVTPYRT